MDLFTEQKQTVNIEKTNLWLLKGKVERDKLEFGFARYKLIDIK